jgi:hypothetical protein
MCIPDPDLDFLPIPEPGSRGQKGTGSRIRIRITTHLQLGWSPLIPDEQEVALTVHYHLLFEPSSLR